MNDETNKPASRARGLGRGLNALFEDEESAFAVTEDDMVVTDVEIAQSVGGSAPRATLGIDLMHAGFAQPRQSFDDESLAQLAESIKTHGLLQPILVRPDTRNEGRYEIIAGERRWRAAQLAQMHEVPVIIRSLSDPEALEIALVENLQREDLNPVDEAKGYRRLMTEYGHTQVELAEALGKSRSHIANMTRLLTLSSGALGLLEDGAISIGHARALIPLINADELAQDIVDRDLSVRQTELLVAERLGKRKSSSAKKAKRPKDVNVVALEKDLEDVLGIKVDINPQGAEGKRGKVTLQYKNLDQLDAILQLLTVSDDAAKDKTRLRD